MTAETRVDEIIADALRLALVGDALPGEIADFGKPAQTDAAHFIAPIIAVRKAGAVAMRLESSGGEVGHRRMRLVIVNDDMPFLVDSIAGAISARGLAVHRLLHPIMRVVRDKDGKVIALDVTAGDKVLKVPK